MYSYVFLWQFIIVFVGQSHPDTCSVKMIRNSWKVSRCYLKPGSMNSILVRCNHLESLSGLRSIKVNKRIKLRLILKLFCNILWPNLAIESLTYEDSHSNKVSNHNTKTTVSWEPARHHETHYRINYSTILLDYLFIKMLRMFGKGWRGEKMLRQFHQLSWVCGWLLSPLVRRRGGSSSIFGIWSRMHWNQIEAKRW